MSKKGGYVIVDLKGQSITAGTPFTLDGVTARLNRAKNKACLLSGFAIGGGEKRDVFVDLQKTEDGYVALFGQYTMTIEDDEVTITNGGVLLDDIVDSQGHKRFQEGRAELPTIEGVTYTYDKWSLSGTHLMMVLAGSIADEKVISNGTNLGNFRLPTWILNKVVIVFASTVLEIKTLDLRANDYSVQNLPVSIGKTNNGVYVTSAGNLTLNADRNFRLVIDLLIDTDEQEVNYNGN